NPGLQRSERKASIQRSRQPTVAQRRRICDRSRWPTNGSADPRPDRNLRRAGGSGEVGYRGSEQSQLIPVQNGPKRSKRKLQTRTRKRYLSFAWDGGRIFREV